MDIEQQRIFLAFFESRGTNHPRIDRRTILGHCCETLRVAKVAALRKRLPKVCQLTAAHIQLRKRGRRRGSVHDDFARRIVSGYCQFACQDNLWRAGAIGGDTIDVRISVVFHGEQQIRSEPDGLANFGVRAAVPVERSRE